MVVTLDQIRKVVREEVEAEVGAAKHNLQVQLLRVEAQVRDVRDRAKTTEILARSIEKRVVKIDAKMDKNHREVKEEIKQVSDFLDRENLKTAKRVKRIDEHLGLPSINS